VDYWTDWKNSWRIPTTQNNGTENFGSTSEIIHMRLSNEPQQGPLFQYLLDVWFSPKRFESTALYERLGVLFIKRHVSDRRRFLHSPLRHSHRAHSR
jgi:hypothetical protein